MTTAAVIGEAALVSCRPKPVEPTKTPEKKEGEITIFNSLVIDKKEGYFISGDFLATKEDTGLMVSKKDKNNSVYKWDFRSQPVRIITTDDIVSNIVVVSRDDLIYASPNSIKKINKDGRVSKLYDLKMELISGMSINYANKLGISKEGEVALIDSHGNLFVGDDKKMDKINLINGSAQGLPVWSPDGNYLAVTFLQSEGLLYYINIYDKNKRFTASIPVGSEEPNWFADSKKIVYQIDDKMDEQQIFPFEKPITLAEGNKSLIGLRWPRLSPDNSKLAFIANDCLTPTAVGSGCVVENSYIQLVDLNNIQQPPVKLNDSQNANQFEWIDDNQLAAVINEITGSSVKTINVR
jgi:hypothetical protein